MPVWKKAILHTFPYSTITCPIMLRFNCHKIEVVTTVVDLFELEGRYGWVFSVGGREEGEQNNNEQ